MTELKCDELWGCALSVDRFGNLVKNIPPTRGEVVNHDGKSWFVCTVDGLQREFESESIYIVNNRAGSFQVYYGLACGIFDHAQTAIKNVSYVLTEELKKGAS